MATQIKIRRDTYANWFNVNPTLGIGEPGYDITNRKLKIGDGVTLWRALGYFDDQVTDLSAYAGNIVPAVDITQNLGSPTRRWQTGFFSGSAVYLGDIKLSNSNGTLVVQRVTNAGLQNEAAVPGTPGSVTTDRLTNGANTVSLAANGNLVTPAFTLPNAAGTSGQVLKWPGSGSTLVWAAASADRLVNGLNEVVLAADGKLTLPGGAGLQSVGVTGADGRQSLASTRTDGSLFLTANSATAGDVYLMGQQNYIISASNISNGASYKTWNFGQSGNITLPAGGDIVDSNGSSVLGGGGGSSVTTGATPPVGPSLGDLWYDTESGRTYIYYDSSWIDASPSDGAAASLSTLTGVAITSPTTGQVLKYNGTSWINDADAVSGGGATAFSALSDATSAGLTVDEIYLQAITRLNVTNNSATAYRFDQYGTTDNPTVYAISGTTIAFNLNVTGHPFLIRTSGGTNYDIGLVHVSTTGTVSTGTSAQGQVAGTLYWKIPASTTGDYQYICGVHSGMVGVITIKDISAI